MPLQSARQAWTYLYAAKLRLLFGISKVFGAFSWWFIENYSFFYSPLFNSNRYYGK